MGKIGLTATQVENMLGSIGQLSRGLDEDLVETGKSVVAILNVYGLASRDAEKITNELAYTVKASALDINSFARAFSYVGGSAKVAGVEFAELAAAMDVLSNSGIRSSTIGTQLRKIISELSNENSKASAILGGKTLKDYGEFADVLEDLASKNLTLGDYTKVFGRTASSVIAILQNYSEEVRRLTQETKDADDMTKTMADTLNNTLKGAIGNVSTSWADYMIELGKNTGPLQKVVNLLAEALQNWTALAQFNRNIDEYTTSDFGKKAMKEDFSWFLQGRIVRPTASMIGGSKGFNTWLKEKALLEQHSKIREDIVNEIAATINAEKALAAVKSKSYAADREGLVVDKQRLEYLKSVINDTKAFDAAFKQGVVKASYKSIAPAEDSVLDSLLPKPIDVEKRTKELEAIMRGFWSSYVDFSALGKQRPQLGEGVFGQSPMDSYKLNEPFGMNFDSPNHRKDRRDELEKIYQFEKQQIDLLIGSWEHLMEMPGQYAAALAMHSGALQSFSDGFSQMTNRMAENIYDMKNPFESLSAIVRDTFKQIMVSIIQATIRLMIFKAIAGGGLPGGGTIGGQVLGSVFPEFMKQATGGTREVNQPTLFMAGESGPETVSVTPRAKAKQSSQSSIQVVIQGDVMDGEKFMEAVRMAEKRLNRRSV